MTYEPTTREVADVDPESRADVERESRERGHSGGASAAAGGPARILDTHAEPTGDGQRASAPAKRGLTVKLEQLRAFYGESEQVKGIDLEFRANEVTAIIGPSGCGKSTMVRCINRMHEEIPGARAEGRVLLEDLDVYGPSVDVVAVRRAVGMVFQKPNPFPTMSIFDNVAAGPRLSLPRRRRGDLRAKVEERTA